MRHPGLANHGLTAGDATILTWLSHPIALTAGVMAVLSLLILPLFLRFILTPLILFQASRSSFHRKGDAKDLWMEEESRELSRRMYGRIKRILLHSESFQIREDFQELLNSLLPPGKEGESRQTLRFDFPPVRFLETLLLAYEDLYQAAEKRLLLRYLLRRRGTWYRPFLRGMQYHRMINRLPIVDFLNRKGLFAQALRLILIPVIGLPGILFYSARSILLRTVWAGLIRYYYTKFLLRAAYYLIYLYGGNTEELTERRRKFSRKEIIRKGAHYDRELSLIPPAGDKPETLETMTEAYLRILSEAGFAPDPLYSSQEPPEAGTSSFKRKWKGFLKRTLSALNREISEDAEQPAMRRTALRILEELPGIRFPGRSKPWLHYRITQGLNVSHRLLLISLSRIYTTAPGSHLAMEKIPVELIRQARDFSRKPLISLLSRTGRNSYRTIKPLLRLRRINRLRKKTTPTGIATLSLPLLGKLIQDRWKELILYRLGRSMIRYSLLEEDSLLLP